MGHNHGIEGLMTFSRMRPVFYQGPVRMLNRRMPPYDKGAMKMLQFMLRLKS